MNTTGNPRIRSSAGRSRNGRTATVKIAQVTRPNDSRSGLRHPGCEGEAAGRSCVIAVVKEQRTLAAQAVSSKVSSVGRILKNNGSVPGGYPDAEPKKEKVVSLNKVMVIGYLGQDPEIRYTPAGLPVANFSVTTNEVFFDKEGKRQDRTEWHRIVALGKIALICKEYLLKGRQVFVEGRLQTREWENHGESSRRTEIIAGRVQFLGAPSQGDVGQASEPSASLESEAIV